MKKLIFGIFIFTIFAVIACEKNNDLDALPKALQDKIATMQSNDYFWGTKLYRYTWNKKYYYEFIIPVSSCAHCEIFDSSGIKLQYSYIDIQKFTQERSGEIMVWEWKKKK